MNETKNTMKTYIQHTDYLENLYTEQTGKESYRSMPMYPNRFDRTPEYEKWLTTQIVVQNIDLLKVLKKTYLKLEMICWDKAKSSIVFAIKTDSTRANLRNIISEITGIDGETVQNDNHTEAMEALKNKSEEILAGKEIKSAEN